MTNRNEELLKEIEKALKPQPRYVPYWHTKIPLFKLRKSRKTMIIYLLVSLTSFALLSVFVLPFTSKKVFYWPIVSLYFIKLFLFLFVSSRDPGYTRKSE